MVERAVAGVGIFFGVSSAGWLVVSIVLMLRGGDKQEESGNVYYGWRFLA